MTNPNEIVLNRIFGQCGRVHFDVKTGAAHPCPETDLRKAKGNLNSVVGHTFALYVENGVLYVQCDNRRWDMATPDLHISYGHDFQNGTTIFAIDGTKVSYPAWWVGDPRFDPNIPERDEDEDYLGYILSVRQQPQLQQSLITSWGHNE